MSLINKMQDQFSTLQTQLATGLKANNLAQLLAREVDGSVPAFVAEMNRKADDLGMTESDLLSLAPNAPDNSALMQLMMKARGLDPEVVRNSFLTLQRDIERVCTQCRATRTCRRELEAGTAAARCHDFCPNAGTFDDLTEYNMGR